MTQHLARFTSPLAPAAFLVAVHVFAQTPEQPTLPSETPTGATIGSAPPAAEAPAPTPQPAEAAVPPAATTTAPSTQPQAAPLPTDPKEVLAIAPTLPIESLEVLLQAADGLNDDVMTQSIAEIIIKRNPKHIDALQQLTYLAIKGKNVSEARDYAARLVAVKPVADSYDALADAWGLRQAGEDNAEAARQQSAALKKLRSVSTTEHPFKRHSELAIACLAAGEWKESYDLWSEVAAAPGSPEELRSDAFYQIDEIARLHMGAAAASITSLWEEGANLISFDQELAVPLSDTWKVVVTGREQWLNDYPSHYHGGTNVETRQSAAVGVLGYFANKIEVGGNVGFINAESSKASGRASIGWNDRESGTLARLEGSINQLASDGLALIQAGGYQHRIALDLEIPLGPNLTAAANIGWREVHAEEARVGDGFNASWSLAWRPFDKWQDLTLAYEGEFADFSYDFEAWKGNGRGDHAQYFLRNLVLEKENNHRGVLEVTHTTGAVTLSARGSAGWKAEQETKEYGIGAGLSWRFTQRARMDFRYEYYSSAQSSFADSDSHLATAALRFTF